MKLLRRKKLTDEQKFVKKTLKKFNNNDKVRLVRLLKLYRAGFYLRVGKDIDNRKLVIEGDRAYV